ncbi:MAG: hypothetical protein ABI723_23090 [Bacteroidia bacterium]
MNLKLYFASAALCAGLFTANHASAQNWSLSGNSPGATDTLGNKTNQGLKIITNNVNRIFIQKAGNVGIANGAPTEKLDVTGNVKASGNVSSATLRVGTTTSATGFIASIGGKLIAEEVRVDLKAAWPDYVFANDYKLMSLEELATSINTYKHLPGIPSATEMKEKGITLGEMQTKTIEKIEEQALYLIQLKKENNELRARIEALENK